MKLFERIRIQPTKLLPWILRGTYLLLLIAILYLSLRSSPSLQELPWLPDWLGAWADRHSELRTAVAYFACGLLCPWVGCRRGEADGFVRWLLSKVVLGCGLLIVLLLTEGVQFFLECRVASFADIALGALGIVLGIALGTWIKNGSSSIRVKGIARKRL
jgi:small-conductance mechanosensitive channel